MASLRIDQSNRTGQFPSAVWRSQEAKTFGARSMSPVAWELAVPDAFQNHESRYVMDDCLTIHCTVEVLQQELQQQDSTAIKNCLVLVPPAPSICQDFYNLLRERRSPKPDVTFILEDDGTEVQAHKLLLAMRSPVFRAQFLRGDMKERSARRLKISGLTASAFRAMLYFIYTDEQPTPNRRRCPVAMAQDLLVAADLYDLERLRLMCEKVLSESIDVGNVMTTLMLAHGRHSCQQLEASCIEFLVSDPDVYDTVEATEEYKELEKTCPSFINKITKKVAKTAVSHHRSPSTSSYTNNGSKMTTRSVSKYTPSVMMSGTHEFTIQCLSAMRKTHGVGQYIRSSSFQVGGYEWTIEVFPSGHKEDITGSIGIFIRPFIHDDDTKVEASVTLKPIDPTGELPPFPRRNFTHVYAGRNCESWGWPKFIIAKYANTDYVGHDGSFTLQCQVEVPTESCTTGTIGVGTIVTVPPSNMAWHLEQLFAREEGSDVKFLVEDSEICAHGLVIATRSPVLHEAVESASSKDLVHPVTPAAASFCHDQLSQFMLRNAGKDVLTPYYPVISRGGFVVLHLKDKSKSKGCFDLCVYDPMTGHRIFLPEPPNTESSICNHHECVLLTEADDIGCSFMLLSIVFNRSRISVRTATSFSASWGPITCANHRDYTGWSISGYNNPAVLRGGVIHWLTHAGDQIITYDIRTRTPGHVKLPLTNRSARHLHLATSRDGNVLKLLDIERFIISVWLQLPRARIGGDGDGWALETVINIEQKLQLLYPDIIARGCPDVEFEGSGDSFGKEIASKRNIDWLNGVWFVVPKTKAGWAFMTLRLRIVPSSANGCLYY
ncbi:uncharacterized protein [Aegilops tauschii subsp. strangulata]|uniref:uncharacterized protein n=1 Tax=Aegilops tauschii subsp. strangulata TaxID=200361 RepID=UPI003CC8C3B0